MTVQDLIAELEKYHPESKVRIDDWEFGHEPIERVVEEHDYILLRSV